MGGNCCCQRKPNTDLPFPGIIPGVTKPPLSPNLPRTPDERPPESQPAELRPKSWDGWAGARGLGSGSNFLVLTTIPSPTLSLSFPICKPKGML